jgi:hypothetical protein
MEDNQLKLLMEYALFHLGVYLTFGGLMISLLGMKWFEKRAVGMRYYLAVALICFVIASFLGGIVASNIPYFNGFDKFTHAWIGPWFATKLLPASFCMAAEHTLFWLGIIVFLAGFVMTGAWKMSRQMGSN